METPSEKEIKNNVYFEKEEKVGTYLGKPLYRKILKGTTANVDTANFIPLIQNVDNFLNFECKFGTEQRPYNYIWDGDRLPLDFLILNRNFCYRVMSSIGANKVFTINIDYTKSTD